MNYQQVNVSKKILLFLFLLFIGFMSATVTHAETYIFVTKWGSEGSSNGQFMNPAGIAVDSSGNVYVADTENNRIQKFDSRGTFIAKWGSWGAGDGQFFNPEGVAVDSSGNVYVTERNNARIQKFSSTGTFLTKWGSVGSNVADVAVDSSGNVYIADTGNHRIQKFDSNGVFITKWGSIGSGDGQFNYPRGVAVDSSGNIYVTDFGNCRVQKFNSNGEFITKWGSIGYGDGQFHDPWGIAVDSSGNVYVSEHGLMRIQKFDSNGAFITKFGCGGNEDGQLDYPCGVAVDSSGNVYVAETYNYRIQKFFLEKTPSTITWNNPADITSGTALSNTQLNAVSSISGTFVYTPSLGTILAVGNAQNLHVDFTPTDTEKYKTASKDVTINVLPAPLKIPTIIWNNPADITSGTALGPEQLNAIATDPNTGNSVTGTFTYNPPKDTVLEIGTHKLHVDFAPANQETYNIASAEVQINVLEQPVILAPIINSIAVPLDPVPVGTSITASADVTYLGDLSTLTAEWSWGDSSTSESQVPSNFETSHVYNSPGIYTINLKITDADGRSETKEASNYIVVYDPQGGFVTGGGWINSPAGAYTSDKTLAGKATFGFVSKYQKGAKVPTGMTEFHFKVANLDFHSENYEWLVVAGSQAKYKGTGTINGEGNYGFMLSAVDGAIKGNGVDKFKIKILDKLTDKTVYDNEIGAGEDAEPSTAIGGGSIIIHNKK